MKITIIAGARPNFMKIAPIIHAIRKLDPNSEKINYRLVHTGQHYDSKLSDSFFKDLDIPVPDANLEVGSASHALQTANIMIRFEKELIENPTDLVLVVGDVNSTMAATLVAKKMDTKVAHVEAGLRSFDMEMPEEINRLVTDILADYFFTTSMEAEINLKSIGIPSSKIFFVGNTMIDSLIGNLGKLEKPHIYSSENLDKGNFILMTLHRPSNVDDIDKLSELMTFISELASNYKIIFPVHPRTQVRLQQLSLLPDNVILIESLRLLKF
ncbi:MAG: UDP-N-acetylglucosamine 2-epimerase (non-hydrolyzing) [Bacteroidetes bacterium]|nr:UDP-N-acetylglucosamine 2-epimerase (non-hydrolyzing) [Bacteroidota bacterium]